jgi:hypothetical protein
LTDTAPSGVVVTGSGWVEDGAVDVSLPGLDPGRLRRMDRFGRSGFLAGSLALLDAGFVRPEAPDPRSGVIFGTAFGCRDSVTEHAALLAASSRVEDLAPAVFAETVHNSVNGELAIAWRLGGVSETLVSGRTSGLEAIFVAAGRIDEGAADLVVAGGAEGLNTAMREAWNEERKAFGERGRSVDLVEAGAALVLERENGASKERTLGRFLAGTTFFEPEPQDAIRRLREWAKAAFFEEGKDEILLASADLEGLLDAEGTQALICLEGKKERLGASGPWAVARALARAGFRSPSSLSKKSLVVVREPGASLAAVALELFS